MFEDSRSEWRHEGVGEMQKKVQTRRNRKCKGPEAVSSSEDGKRSVSRG